MNKSIWPYFRRLGTWSVVLLMVQGCASTPPPKFFVLSSLSDLQQDAPVRKAENPLVIGIGPVNIPDYLDRMQIVLRTGQSSLEISEYNRWAEPLDKSIGRVLGDNLGRLLETHNLVFYPWPSTTHIDCQVTVEVMRFDGAPSQKARLEACWTLWGSNPKQVLARRSSTLTEPVDGPSFEALVGALSRLMTSFSREIAATVTSEVKPRQGSAG